MVKLEPALMTGTWYATDKEAAVVVRLELSENDDGVVVRAFGDSDGRPYDWGEVRATLYGSSTTATQAMAFSALYDFGAMTALLAAYAKQGILVLDTFTVFKEPTVKDDSGRADYFSREFFHR
ncbi:hypothetical protein [Actinocrispum wychmicini]|uniref:Uncharacterized protein n=1 Tax=Actinocrispum wychmicini TaxID=1213861 RepID=A0A4R2INE5_9PSEU|nr:hypothetical protein [Actinocrispum wychmicini]TCO46633.1 hypothetical protein EV192_11828 [Actinocrispum wychmicini]